MRSMLKLILKGYLLASVPQARGSQAAGASRVAVDLEVSARSSRRQAKEDPDKERYRKMAYMFPILRELVNPKSIVNTYVGRNVQAKTHG